MSYGTNKGGLTTPLKYSGTGIHILNISRIALKVSADASLRATKMPRFEPDAKIGQINVDFERRRFKIGSQGKVFRSLTFHILRDKISWYYMSGRKFSSGY